MHFVPFLCSGVSLNAKAKMMLKAFLPRNPIGSKNAAFDKPSRNQAKEKFRVWDQTVLSYGPCQTPTLWLLRWIRIVFVWGCLARFLDFLLVYVACLVSFRLVVLMVWAVSTVFLF